MSRPNKAICMVSILLASTLLSGCLSLVIQREVMEGMREGSDPHKDIDLDVTVGWSETFDTGTEIDSVLYSNETELIFDETVSKLVINFRAQFPYSSQIEEFIGNDTNQLRYVEATLWKPGTQSAGGDPFWHVKATQDYPLERFEWTDMGSDFVEGIWILEVEARGYGVTAPIEQLSFHDHFDLYATITKPCVRFPQSHEIGECTFLSDLED
ncbi:MAG TPA: hypothetical protein QF641_02055 [Candidatus Thalassarchaeaceae archaeon]|nr:hypothetical protein [Candidatus Thalassarchaeaceae archaeon]